MKLTSSLRQKSDKSRFPQPRCPGVCLPRVLHTEHARFWCLYLGVPIAHRIRGRANHRRRNSRWGVACLHDRESLFISSTIQICKLFLQGLHLFIFEFSNRTIMSTSHQLLALDSLDDPFWPRRPTLTSHSSYLLNHHDGIFVRARQITG